MSLIGLESGIVLDCAGGTTDVEEPAGVALLVFFIRNLAIGLLLKFPNFWPHFSSQSY